MKRIGPEKQLVLRETRLEDWQALQGVWSRNGLRTLPQDQWEHLWVDNPFRRLDVGSPPGWVIEDQQNQIVGTLGNIVIGWEWRGRRWRAAVGTTWAVDAAWRGVSLALVAEYFAQAKVDLFINTTNGDAAAAVWRLFRARPMPNAVSERVLSWTTNYFGLMEDVLRRKKIPTARLLKYPGGFALGLMDWLRGQRTCLSPRGRVQAQNHFDERFDEFWAALCRRYPDRLMTVRDRRALCWHFEFGFRAGTTQVFTLEHSGALAGYLVMRRKDTPDIGLKRLIVVDLQVLEENTEHVTSLMQAALEFSRQQGVHVVEVIGQEPFKRHALESLNPRVRAGPSAAYWYKAANPELEPDINADRIWDPSPYDGDASLCL